MPHEIELALHVADTFYSPPTACTHARKLYWYPDRPFPYYSTEQLPDGLPRAVRDRPALVCTQQEIYPPWLVFGRYRVCRRCHDTVHPSRQSPSGLSVASCFCRDCANRVAYARRLRRHAIRPRVWFTDSDAFWALSRPQRAAYLAETDRLRDKARRLARPVPPPWRVLGVPAYWKAPSLSPGDPRAVPVRQGAVLPHIPIHGARNQDLMFVYNPKSRPFRRFLRSLKGLPPTIYDPQPLPLEK